MATVGVNLVGASFPNGYNGASPGFAPFTQFNSEGQAVGGYGTETLMSSGAHSTYQSLQAGVGKNSMRFGLGFQASYTYSKALDDGSSTFAMPQDPFNPGADKGPANFDVTQVFSFSLIQSLPEVEIAMDMDGFGSRALKVSTYRDFIADQPVEFTGFKLFYKNDVKLGGAS